MTAKKWIFDFLCAFAVFMIVMLSIALLTGETFFEGAVEWDGEEAVLNLFGTEILFDKKLPFAAQKLLEFNNLFFGKDFSAAVGECAYFAAEYVKDGISLAYHVAKSAVGAE